MRLSGRSGAEKSGAGKWLGRLAQCCPLKPLQPGVAKNGGGQNARATGGPGILPETRMGCFKCKVDSIGRLAQYCHFSKKSSGPGNSQQDFH